MGFSRLYKSAWPASILVGIISLAAIQATAIPASAQSVFTGFTGQLLVASPRMGDPRFTNSVIFIFSHSKNGAAGLIVNQPSAVVPLGELYELAEVGAENVTGEVTVFVGGPVAPDAGFVLHDAAAEMPGSETVDGGFAVSNWHGFLGALAGAAPPARALFLLGLSSWGPGQLEREVIEGAWTSVPAEMALVFTDDPDGLWDLIVEARKFDL